MQSMLEPEHNKLLIYHEGRKRRIFVGELKFDADKNKYIFTYDKQYTQMKSAIPLSPHLDLFTLQHTSKKGALFPVFVDRIPSKSNPAYGDYCHSQGISIDESNPIILLGTIGKRGPSSFVFELVYSSKVTLKDITNLRKELQITQYDFALAFDIREITLQRVEAGTSTDPNTLKRIEIYMTFPEVALWQLQQTGAKIHHNVLSKLIKYFRSKQTQY